MQNTASINQSRVVNVDGTKRRFLQRTVQPIRSVKSSPLPSEIGHQQAHQKPPLHPQYSEEQRAHNAIIYQQKSAIEQQVQQQLQQMEQLGLQPDAARSSSRVLAAATTPALHAALRSKAAPSNAHHGITSSGSQLLSNISHQSPCPSQVRPRSCSTRSSVSRLSAGNLWKASDSVASDKRSSTSKSSAMSSEVDSQIGYLEETLAREKLRRMAAESELAYLKEVVLTTRQQLSRPLL